MLDESARRAFILIHIPLFAALLWLVTHPVDDTRFWVTFGKTCLWWST
jgi:hypothetical protein